MITTKLVDNKIRINCTKNQVIDTRQLKHIYRAGRRFILQHGNKPIIVSAEKNVTLTGRAKKIFRRLDARCSDITLIIVSG